MSFQDYTDESGVVRLRAKGGGGGSQTLADTLTLGNDADGLKIANLAEGTDPADAATVAQLSGFQPVTATVVRLTAQTDGGAGTGTYSVAWEAAYDGDGNSISSGELRSLLDLQCPLNGNDPGLDTESAGVWVVSLLIVVSPDATGAIQLAMADSQPESAVLGCGGPVPLDGPLIQGGITLLGSANIPAPAQAELQFGVTVDGQTADPYTFSNYALAKITRIA